MDRILTTCGYCGCGCNYYFNVEDNEILGVTPMNTHVVSQGKLCIKGWQGFSFVTSKDRLKEPQLMDAHGNRSNVSWEEAFGQIKQRFEAIIEKHGSGAVGFLASARCTNEENYLMVKLARAVLKTPNIDHCARL